MLRPQQGLSSQVSRVIALTCSIVTRGTSLWSKCVMIAVADYNVLIADDNMPANCHLTLLGSTAITNY